MVHTSTKEGLCIVAGEGTLPSLVAQVASDKYDVFIIGIRGVSEPAIERFAHIWLPRIQLGRIEQYAKREKNLLVIGRFQRSLVWRVAIDWIFVRYFFSVMRALMGGDDQFSRFLARKLQAHNIEMLGVQEVAPTLLAPKGLLTKAAPHEQDFKDMQKGQALLQALSPFDVGQGAVVAQERVIAIEAADGTNRMLQHVRDIVSAGGKGNAKQRVGVFIKILKLKQDRRLDLPVVGVDTIEHVARAGLRGLAIESGGVIIAHIDDVIRKANEYGLFIYGL